MKTDIELLRLYADGRDAEAFAELVRRHAGLVYGTCLRANGDRHAAEDASQECFLQLARQAGAISTSLPGWLHQTALSRARMEQRGEARRHRREEEAAAMNTHARSEPTWDEIAPHVDDALNDLPEELREPLILHFLEGKNQEQVAAELAISQPTVSRRIDKGVSLLRDRLKKSGIILSAIAAATLLGQNAATAAPATLSATLGKMALCGISATGQAATTTTATTTAATGAKLIGGISAMKLGIASVVVVAAIATTVIVTQPAPAAPPTVQAPVEISVMELPPGTPDGPVTGDAAEVQLEVRIIEMTSKFEEAQKVRDLVGTNVPTSIIEPLIKVAQSSSEATIVSAPHVTGQSGMTQTMNLTTTSSYISNYGPVGENLVPIKTQYFPSRIQFRCRPTVNADAIVLSNIGVLKGSTALVQCSGRLTPAGSGKVRIAWSELLQQKYLAVPGQEFRIASNEAIVLPMAQTSERGYAKLRLSLVDADVKEEVSKEAKAILSAKQVVTYAVLTASKMPEEKRHPVTKDTQFNVTVELYPSNPRRQGFAPSPATGADKLPVMFMPADFQTSKVFPINDLLARTAKTLSIGEEGTFELSGLSSSKLDALLNVTVQIMGANEKYITTSVSVQTQNTNGVIATKTADVRALHNARLGFTLDTDTKKGKQPFFLIVTPREVGWQPVESTPAALPTVPADKPAPVQAHDVKAKTKIEAALDMELTKIVLPYMPLAEALDMIKKVVGPNLDIKIDPDVDENKIVGLEMAENVTVRRLLQDLLRPQGLGFVVRDGVVRIYTPVRAEIGPNGEMKVIPAGAVVEY